MPNRRVVDERYSERRLGNVYHWIILLQGSKNLSKVSSVQKGKIICEERVWIKKEWRRERGRERRGRERGWRAGAIDER